MQLKTDPRVERTRAALLGAFNRLLLARGYDAISPATIATAAGVSRSTFYEHYAGKPALLRQASQRVLQPLADALDPRRPPDVLEAVIAHFWDNRRLARVLMAGRPRTVMLGLLTELIESNLRHARYTALIPLSMAANHIAQGQLAMVDAWIGGRHGCDAATVAKAIRATAVAAVDALRSDDVADRQRAHGGASSDARP